MNFDVLTADSTHEESALIFAVTTEGPWVGIKNHNFINSNIVLPMEWNHFCLAYNNRNKSAVMVQNGRVVLNVSNYEPFDSRPFKKGTHTHIKKFFFWGGEPPYPQSSVQTLP